MDGCTFEIASERALAVEIEGLPVKVLSLEDYVATKTASARPKDFDDLRRLGEILGRKLD